MAYSHSKNAAPELPHKDDTLQPSIAASPRYILHADLTLNRLLKSALLSKLLSVPALHHQQ